MKKMKESEGKYACARRVLDANQGYVGTVIVGSTVSFDFSMMNTTTRDTPVQDTRYYQNNEYEEYEKFADRCCLGDKDKIRIGDVSNGQAT